MVSAPPPTKKHQGEYRNPNPRVDHDQHYLLIQWKPSESPAGQQIEGDNECSKPMQYLCDRIVEFYLRIDHKLSSLASERLKKCPACAGHLVT
jgi:hypothetical protein